MILEKIKNVVAEQLGVDEAEINLETSFQDDLDADSLDLFQIVIDLEETFDIKIEEVEQLKTIGDAVKFVESRIEK